VDKILEDAWRSLMNLKDTINGMTKEVNTATNHEIIDAVF
jgi:hypothetical protein